MVRTRRESHHCNGITDPKRLQPSFATKSAKSRHSAPRQKPPLFDHIVGAGEHRWRNCEAEGLCGLEIDDQFILGRRLHREIARLLALEDAID